MDATALPFGELRAALDARELRASEVTRAYLERSERLAGLQAWNHLDAEGALAAAGQADRELDAGERRGPLHGVPIGVKDGYPVAGMPLTLGSRALYDVVPAEDCEVVARARAGGAVVLGVQSMHEAGLGDPVREGPLATGVNPRNPAYLPGGSSSGSAVATAAGLCVLSIGGDGGGSVRNPAAACGVVGLKPTDDRMPSRNEVPWCWSLGTSGLLGRDVETVAAGFAVVAGGGAPAAAGRPRVLALPEDAHGELAPEVRAAYREVREALGAEEGPALDLAQAGPAWLARVKELGAVHALLVLARRELYGESILALQEATAAVTREDYLASFETERRLAAELEAALAGYDALLTPANPRPALRWDEWPSEQVFDWFRFCWPFNLVRWPGITLPWALADEGLPVAFQLVARLGEDERLLGVAAHAEALADFDRAPVEPAAARA